MLHLYFMFFWLHKVCDSWTDAVNLFFPLFTQKRGGLRIVGSGAPDLCQIMFSYFAAL